MQTDFKVAIIGGGSAGLFAGVLLSQKFHGNVAILERLDRVGKKLLATGNGQGNLTNTDLSLSHYHGDIRLAESVFSVASGKETSARLESVGISLFPDERGRVYPMGKQASSVLDMLRKAFGDNGGKEITQTEIVGITPTANGFTLTAKNGKVSEKQKCKIRTFVGILYTVQCDEKYSRRTRDEKIVCTDSCLRHDPQPGRLRR